MSKARLRNSPGEMNLSLTPMVPVDALATGVKEICSYCSFNLNSVILGLEVLIVISVTWGTFSALLLSLTSLYLEVKFFQLSLLDTSLKQTNK